MHVPVKDRNTSCMFERPDMPATTGVSFAGVRLFNELATGHKLSFFTVSFVMNYSH